MVGHLGGGGGALGGGSKTKLPPERCDSCETEPMLLAVLKCWILGVQVPLTLADLKWHLVSRQRTCDKAVSRACRVFAVKLRAFAVGKDNAMQFSKCPPGGARVASQQRCVLTEAFTSKKNLPFQANLLHRLRDDYKDCCIHWSAKYETIP